MSKAFSKNKVKRRRPSSNEVNNSFVKNVTSRVSGLLPATITKWFSSPSSSNTNGSAPVADVSDSSTDDECQDTPVITQPPAKRMRYGSSSNTFNHFGSSEVNSNTSNMEITEIPVGHMSGTQFSTSRNSFTLTNETFTNETIKEKNDRDSSRYKSPQHTILNLGKSVATKRKSIFDRSPTTSNRDETVGHSEPSTSEKKMASYQPMLFASPFYPGRTTYGGAAATYVNQPNIQQETVALVNETKSSDDSAMSTSARRIMELLESYSSPLMEARRIPLYTKPKIESYHASSIRSSPYENRSLSYKTQELYVPSIASILRVKQRSRLMDATKAARQIIASHSSASSYPLTYPSAITNTLGINTIQDTQTRPQTESEQSNKMTTKVKTRVARTNRGNQDQFELTTPVKLPSATLQIDQNQLPKFSFDTPAVTKLPATSTPKVVFPTLKSTESKNSIEVITSKPESVTNSNIFKFSNPIQVSCDTHEPDITPPKFTFDSPERRIENHSDSKSDVSSVVGKVKETENSANKAKDWQCPDCWVNNKSDVTKCVCCGHNQKKAVKAAKCSVCKLADSQAQKDKCVNCEKVSNLPALVKPSQSSKWKCDGCWIMNDNSSEKCPCCGGIKSNEADKTEKATEMAAFPNTKIPSFNAVQNNTNKLPSDKMGFFGSKTDGDSTFVSLAKSQKTDKWECTGCLVRNDSDKSACVCCGAEKDPKKTIPDTKFNFGLNADASFKFGIDPKVQEATLAKKPTVQLVPESKLKEQSETNNNVLAETPTFTFTLPAKKPETKSDSTKEKPAVTAKFSFGIPKNLGASPKLLESSDTIDDQNEKLQEVPQVNFAAPIEVKRNLTGSFETPLTKEVEKDKPSMLTSNLFALPKADAQKDTPSVTNTLQPAVTSAEKPPLQNTFTFGSPNLKIASKLFNTSNSSSTNIFASPSLSSAPSSSTSAFTLPVAAANKSETALVPTVPALAVSSSAVPALSVQASVVPPATAAPAPIFSFGRNGINPLSSASASTIAEKPKMQFTFGSNNLTKTDTAPTLMGASGTQPVFKSLFAPVSENNANNNNTFSLTQGNTLAPNNSLSSNTLSGSNGISATNGLVSNSLSANPIGGSTLTGSSSSNLLGNNNMTNAFATNSLTSGNVISSTNTIGGTNGLPGNTLAGGNGMQPSNTLASNSSNIFGNIAQKDNLWNPTPNNNASSANLFVSNSTTNNLQKPAAFTFGSSTGFNANSSTPAFGSNTLPAQNMFGINNNNQNSGGQMSLFTNQAQSPTPAPMFGSPQPSSNAVPQMSMFGSSTLGAAPSFGAPAVPVPSFDTTSMTPAPTPAFNFGAPSSTPIFGFGQQQPQQQDQTGGVYNFGGPQPVQFAMGTASNTATRRIRKARRTPR